MYSTPMNEWPGCTWNFSEFLFFMLFKFGNVRLYWIECHWYRRNASVYVSYVFGCISLFWLFLFHFCIVIVLFFSFVCLFICLFAFSKLFIYIVISDNGDLISLIKHVVTVPIVCLFFTCLCIVFLTWSLCRNWEKICSTCKSTKQYINISKILCFVSIIVLKFFIVHVWQERLNLFEKCFMCTIQTSHL